MTRPLLLIINSLLVCAAASADIDAAREQELRYLLKQDCGSCHGLTLKGGLGPSLLPAALVDKPAELLVAIILEGRPNTAMPPWKALLTPEEAAWLVVQLQRGAQ